nr:unnamed protein product [Callosobruchus chinensis]
MGVALKNVWVVVGELNEPKDIAQNAILAEIEYWDLKFERVVDSLELLKVCYEDIFPHLHTILRIFITLPISNASPETLRRLKTWLRSKMEEERLTGLAPLHIHRNIEVDPEERKMLNDAAEYEFEGTLSIQSVVLQLLHGGLHGFLFPFLFEKFLALLGYIRQKSVLEANNKIETSRHSKHFILVIMMYGTDVLGIKLRLELDIVKNSLETKTFKLSGVPHNTEEELAGTVTVA